MELRLLRTFQRHVADQCRFALSGVPAIERSLLIADHDALWVGCQQFVVGTANVSKALWGYGGKLKDERRTLRESLNVADDSPIRATRLRNHFEHYDERIDRWWSKSTSRNHLDKMIGPPDRIAGLDDVDRFRVYDPATHRIIFWGEEFRVEPIVAALVSLHSIAETEASKPMW
jgi:hypothetical protein